MEESLLKLKLTEDEGANSFMNLLVVNCFNTLLTLFQSNKSESNESSVDTTASMDSAITRLLRDYSNQKSTCVKSIKRDYRFVNLLCLYRQAELNIEHCMSSTNSLVNSEFYQHFSGSLTSMRNSLKTFIDDTLDIS